MSQRIPVEQYRKMKGVKLPDFMYKDGVLTIELTPMGKPRQTQRDKWQQRPCVVRYRELADQLRAVLKLTGFELGKALYVDFHLPMAKSWSKLKQAEKLGTYHDQKPDIDNMCKSIMDALCKEDKQIHTCFARKYWANSGKIVLYESAEKFLSRN